VPTSALQKFCNRFLGLRLDSLRKKESGPQRPDSQRAFEFISEDRNNEY
jgi:hypothetical protein